VDPHAERAVKKTNPALGRIERGEQREHAHAMAQVYTGTPNAQPSSAPATAPADSGSLLFQPNARHHGKAV